MAAAGGASSHILKQHSIAVRKCKHRTELPGVDPDSQILDGLERGGASQPSLQRNLMSALLNENSRLVDLARSALRDLQRAQNRISAIEAELATYSNQG
ncbi:MAG: hypothetical protein JWO42_3488 [Chloroflexi bacterium]|jgi:hypothetical protein|nr:hypothetical protein [Chloroflexota bacterium]